MQSLVENVYLRFLTTWVTEENSSKCFFVLISMLGRVKNSHYSSCYARENLSLQRRSREPSRVKCLEGTFACEVEATNLRTHFKE